MFSMFSCVFKSFQNQHFKVDKPAEKETIRGRTVTTTRVDSAAKLDDTWPEVGEWIGLWSMINGLEGVGKVLQRYDEAAANGKKSKRKYPETFFDIFLYMDKNGNVMDDDSDKALRLKVGIGNTCLVERINADEVEDEINEDKVIADFIALDEKFESLRKEIQDSKSAPFSSVLIEKREIWKRDYKSKQVPKPKFVEEKNAQSLFRAVEDQVQDYLLNRKGACSWVLCQKRHDDVAAIRDWAIQQGKGEIECYIESWQGRNYDHEPELVYERGMSSFDSNNINCGNLHLKYRQNRNQLLF